MLHRTRKPSTTRRAPFTAVPPMELHARYPHSQGRTSLSYSPCGRYLFTTGENMLVRRFLVGAPGDEPETLDVDSTGTTIRATKDRFVVGMSSGSVQLFDTDSMRLVTDISRAALPVRSVDISSDGAWAAIAGDDSCRIVNLADITNLRSVRLDGSKADENVRHLVFHPVRPDIVAISTMDGTVRIADLNSRMNVAEFDALVPSVSEFGDARSTAAAWSPSGKVFALPTKTFGIALISAEDWLIGLRLTEGGHENAITFLAWSPNGRYLASAGRDGKVLVWDAIAKAVIKSYDVSEVLEVVWHPHDNELSFTTSKGQLYTVNDVVDASLAAPFGGEVVNSLEALPSLKRPSVTFGAEAENSGDDLGLGLSSDLEIEKASDYESETFVHVNSRPKRSRIDVAAPTSALSALQEPFQSGATPWLNQKRYLCMSSIGYVWSVRQSKTHNSTTISFFDQSLHREVHFQDNDRFDLASLTSDACLFANSQSGKIAVRFQSSLTDNWDIDLDLDVDGGVQCIALSSEVAVVYTKAGFMRTYTSFGAPWMVARVGGGSGRVLACAAFGNEVITIHQQAANSYTYTLEDVGQGLFHQKNDALEVAPGASVTSVFFSEDGEPYIMDSSGVLSTLVHARTPGQARWVPVFSNTSAADLQTKYWPLGVIDSKLLCVILRGQRRYPNLPLPITDEMDLHTPGTDGLASSYLVARTQWQQLFDRVVHMEKAGSDVGDDLREELSRQEIELDKMLLRQFQAACVGQRINRGLQVVALIRHEESLQAAAKIAMAFQLTTLAERILEAVE